MNRESPLDVFIPVSAKDIAVLPLCVESVFRHVRPQPARIVIVAAKLSLPSSTIADLSKHGRIDFIDEDDVFEDYKRSDMPQIAAGGLDRTGWYFQQFLKWELRRCARSEDYVVIDSDVVFIKRTNFIRDGKYVFWTKPNVHVPYFEACNKLLGYWPADRNSSYVVDYMVFSRKIVDEIVARVEDGKRKRWQEIIINDVIDKTAPHSFSEYQTYASYVVMFHGHLAISVAQGADLSFHFFQRSLNRLWFLPAGHHRRHCLLKPIGILFGFSGIAYPSHLTSRGGFFLRAKRLIETAHAGGVHAQCRRVAAKLLRARRYFNEEFWYERWLERTNKRMRDAPAERRKRLMKEIFTEIYGKQRWGAGGDFFSGTGSVSAHADGYIKYVEDFIREHGIKSVVDCGCGDFRISGSIDWGECDYIGIDIVGSLIERDQQLYGAPRRRFMQRDVVTDVLPDAELCLIRQVLQHLPNEAILAIVSSLKKYKYVLISDEWSDANVKYGRFNEDISCGNGTRMHGLDLSRPPFNLPVKEVCRTVIQRESVLEMVVRTVLYVPATDPTATI
jgi:hypothetical protein